ncbi:MAG: thioredoxin family protein [Aeromicrobium sp.]
MVGLIVLVAALVFSAVAALVMKWRNGRFSSAAAPGPGDTVLSAQIIGAPLGRDATLVQFSSAFCAPCRATRVLLADIASKTDGVVTVEIDAEDNLELVRDLSIMRTPTVLVLDHRGVVRTRASGLPRREQVMAALTDARAG